MRLTAKFIRMRRERLAATKAWAAQNGASEIHLAVDALGMPIRAIVTDGPRADCKETILLIKDLPVKNFWPIAATIRMELSNAQKIPAFSRSSLQKRIEKFNAPTMKIFIKNAISSKTLSFA